MRRPLLIPLIALLFAGLIVFTTGAAWINALLFAFPVTLVYAFATGFSSYYLCRAYPLADKRLAPATRLAALADFDDVLGLGLTRLTRADLRVRPVMRLEAHQSVGEGMKAAIDQRAQCREGARRFRHLS